MAADLSQKKTSFRTSASRLESLDAEAKQRGITRNDILNEKLDAAENGEHVSVRQIEEMIARGNEAMKTQYRSDLSGLAKAIQAQNDLTLRLVREDNESTFKAIVESNKAVIASVNKSEKGLREGFPNVISELIEHLVETKMAESNGYMKRYLAVFSTAILQQAKNIYDEDIESVTEQVNTAIATISATQGS